MSFGAFEWKNSGALARRIEAVHAGTRPNSTANQKFRKGLLELIRTDHARKLNDSVDKQGRAMAPLAKRTLANPKRPPGGPLGTARSRLRTRFDVRWDSSGGRWILIARFIDVPFAIYHMQGASDPRRNWRLPKRDLMGVTPKGWIVIYQLQAQHREDVRRYGG